MNPIITVIVPVYNEIELIENKVKNLLSQDYAGFLDIIIVDGGSNDMTHMAAKRWEAILWDGQGPKYDGRMLRVIITDKGKTNQVNAGIKEAKGSIVLITDVDAIMAPGCVRVIESEFKPGVAVVGAWTRQKNAIWIDRCYWHVSNWIRYIESKFVSASHVVAPCYAFRKELLDEFPCDVVADDVHISMVANFKGLIIKYAKSTIVHEMRGPINITQFYQHKMRKGRAFLKELLRFFYLMPTIHGKRKTVYILKLIQFSVLTPTVFVSYFFKNEDSCYRKVH